MTSNKRWFSNKSSKYLTRARALLNDRKKWEKEIQQEENSDDSTLFDITSDDDASKETLERQVRILEQQAHAKISEADSKHRDLERGREEGAWKAANQVQRFLKCFSDFLNGYSGIIECVKAADNQFGGLAYGTLSILLRVVSRKQEREDLLETEIREITRYFPRLATWNEIYPEDDLESRIADVFADIIQFARKATEYYQGSTLGRIGKSANIKDPIEQKIKEIRENLAEIKSDCEVLMHKRIYDLADDVKRLNKKLDQNNEAEDIRNLTTLGHAIGRKDDSFNRDSDLTSYESLLNFTFERLAPVPGLSSMTLPKLSQDPIFSEWYNNMDTGMILCSGTNWPGFSQTTLSWLSQASVLFVRKLQKENKTVASIFCQRSITMMDADRMLMNHVFGDLVYQLAAARPGFLRAHGVDVNSRITGDDWNEENQETAFKTISSLLAKLLSAFDTEDEVYLVLDRPDQCCHYQENMPVDLPLALLHLLRVIKSTSCKVKVMVVTGPRKVSFTSIARPSTTTVDEREMLRKLLLERSGWHQE